MSDGINNERFTDPDVERQARNMMRWVMAATAAEPDFFIKEDDRDRDLTECERSGFVNHAYIRFTRWVNSPTESAATVKRMMTTYPGRVNLVRAFMEERDRVVNRNEGFPTAELRHVPVALVSKFVYHSLDANVILRWIHDFLLEDLERTTHEVKAVVREIESTFPERSFGSEK